MAVDPCIVTRGMGLELAALGLLAGRVGFCGPVKWSFHTFQIMKAKEGRFRGGALWSYVERPEQPGAGEITRGSLPNWFYLTRHFRK